MGRHSEFSQDVADAICAEIMDGKSLRKICEADGMPGVRTVYAWLTSNTEFQHQYARAREVQADLLFDEAQAVAQQKPERVTITIGEEATKEQIDTGDVQHRRLLIDTIKWRAGKLRPKVYGDKQEIEHSGTLNIATELANRMQKAQERVNGDGEQG